MVDICVYFCHIPLTQEKRGEEGGKGGFLIFFGEGKREEGRRRPLSNVP